MRAIRHKGASTRGSDDTLLDAARACILAVGWRRTTLTDVARRAAVSRMTIYRRWPDTQTLLSDLMTREWSEVVQADAFAPDDASPGSIAADMSQVVRGLRGNELFRRIVEVDPELLLPYLLDRRGRTQDTMLQLLQSAISAGQERRLVGAGDPVLLSRAVLLAAHGFALSASTMTRAGVSATRLDAELRALVERYLRP